MRVIDPGHEYDLDSLDGEQSNHLVFVKREGAGYPGNVGHHPGTTMQEVLRALIDRAVYVNDQIFSEETSEAIEHMKRAIILFELRAAKRHGRDLQWTDDEMFLGIGKCKKCGHVGCEGECH
jgi:hypothetical protein